MYLDVSLPNEKTRVNRTYILVGSVFFCFFIFRSRQYSYYVRNLEAQVYIDVLYKKMSSNYPRS